MTNTIPHNIIGLRRFLPKWTGEFHRRRIRDNFDHLDYIHWQSSFGPRIVWGHGIGNLKDSREHYRVIGIRIWGFDQKLALHEDNRIHYITQRSGRNGKLSESTVPLIRIPPSRAHMARVRQLFLDSYYFWRNSPEVDITVPTINPR